MTIFNSRFSKRDEDLIEGFLLYAQKYAREKSKTRGTSGINTRRYYRELDDFIKNNFNVIEDLFIKDITEKGKQKRSISLRRGDLAYIRYKTNHPSTEIYDEQAVSLMLRHSKKTSTTYGLNFHYMPINIRRESIRLLKNNTINFPVRTLHSYIQKKRLEVYKIPYDLWSSFVLLPLEKFWEQKTKDGKPIWTRIPKEEVWKWTMKNSRKVTGTIQKPSKGLKTNIENDIQEDIKFKLNRMLNKKLEDF